MKIQDRKTKEFRDITYFDIINIKMRIVNTELKDIKSLLKKIEKGKTKYPV